MKPWLEKTLAWLAIAVVVLAILWLVLDRKSNSDLEAQRARWAANGWPVDPAELLPAADPNLPATLVYSDAMDRLVVSSMSQGAIERWSSVYLEVGRLWLQFTSNPAERASPPAGGDDPVFEQALSDIEEALLAPDCQVFYVMEGQSPAPLGNWFRLPLNMEHRARREFLRGNRVGALADVVGLFAYAGRLREVPTLEFCEDSDDCLLKGIQLLRTLAAHGSLDAACAERIQPWLARVHPEADWIRAFDGERVLVGAAMWARMREGLEPLRGNIPRDRLGLLYTKLARPWRLKEEEVYFDLLDQKRALLVDRPWEKVAAPPIPAYLLMNRTISSSIFCTEPPVTPRSLDGEIRLRVRRARDLADIALRLVLLRAETGTCPDSLASLPDLPCEPPLCNPYSFARTETGFTLGLSDPSNDPDGAHTWRVEWSPAR